MRSRVRTRVEARVLQPMIAIAHQDGLFADIGIARIVGRSFVRGRGRDCSGRIRGPVRISIRCRTRRGGGVHHVEVAELPHRCVSVALHIREDTLPVDPAFPYLSRRELLPSPWGDDHG